MDGGTHLVSELLWCTGLRVVEVSAVMDDATWDVRAALSARLSNGALATLSILADSGIAAKRQHSIYYGSAGTAELRGFPFTVRIAAGKEELHRREEELPAPPTPVANLVDCILRQGSPAMTGELVRSTLQSEDAARGMSRLSYLLSDS